MTKQTIKTQKPSGDTLTKAQLSEALIEQLPVGKIIAKEIVEAFFEVISEEVLKGEDVRISGFGNFQVRHKSPRPGRNIHTGEVVPISERTVVTFASSQKLKEHIQAHCSN